jgi:hypothetical protein
MTILQQIKKFLSSTLGLIVMAGIGVGIIAFVNLLIYTSDISAILHLVALFMVFGAFLGSIYAWDPRSGLTSKDYPVARMCTGIVTGIFIAITFKTHFIYFAIFATIFGLLGWLGMRWAKYIDF